MGATERLHGEQILILEEHPEIAALIAGMIEALGGRVVGPTGQPAEALRLLVEQDVEAAILDVKIEGEPTTPIAEELIRRGIPWAFTSANRQNRLRQRYPEAHIVRKPFSADQLRDELVSLLKRIA